MGRMKDKLGDGPVTISVAYAFHAIAVLVTCDPPCRHTGSVRLESLNLPRSTLVSDIAKLRRFTCKECGRRAGKSEVDWDAVDKPTGVYGITPP